MDPVEALMMLLDNLASASLPGVSDTMRDNCLHFASEHAKDLSEWLGKGGFGPKVETVAARTFRVPRP